MVRDLRIKDFTWSNIGSLTTPATGTLSAQYSTHVINGTIQKVVVKQGNWADAGSIFIQESGTGEVLATFRNVGSGIIYPVHTGNVTNTGAASAILEMQPVVNSLILLTGSGLGNATSGNLVGIYYI